MTAAQLAWEGGGLPFPFLKTEKSALILQKNCPDFGKVCHVCVHLYGLNYHSKCSFKSILEKWHQNLHLWGLSFVCRTWNVYQGVPIPRNLPCPEKFLVARLNWSLKVYNERLYTVLCIMFSMCNKSVLRDSCTE